MPKNKQTPQRWHPGREDDELIFSVCDRFFSQMDAAYQSPSPDSTVLEGDNAEKKGAATAVANWLKLERHRPDLTREKIYPLLWEALKRGFLKLQTPFEQGLEENLREHFDLPKESYNISVVNVGINVGEHVTTQAAELIVSLIDKVYKDKKSRWKKGEPLPEVHLGMGAGYAAMKVAKRLAQRVNAGIECPTLVLHAISSGGFLVDEPYKAPTSFFSYFDKAALTVKYVALFSATVVNSTEYDEILTNPGIQIPFSQRDEIDIVMTSLADAHDDHGLLYRYLKYLVEKGALEAASLDKMLDAGWVGDVQFRPYSEKGPLAPDDCPVRAVTLFELEQLVELTKTPGKHVVLVAGPCGECGTTKKSALKPLLANPALRLWTDMVIDAKSARELLDD